MYKYKNTTNQELVIVGVGVVMPGAVLVTDEMIDNPNLELMVEIVEPKDRKAKEQE